MRSYAFEIIPLIIVGAMKGCPVVGSIGMLISVGFPSHFFWSPKTRALIALIVRLREPLYVSAPRWSIESGNESLRKAVVSLGREE